jgi:hypothetical protein
MWFSKLHFQCSFFCNLKIHSFRLISFLVMSFSKHKPGFHPKPVHMGLMLGKAALGKFCSKYFLFSTFSIIPPMPHAPSPALYSRSKWQCHWVTLLKIHSNLFLYIHVIIAYSLNRFFFIFLLYPICITVLLPHSLFMCLYACVYISMISSLEKCWQYSWSKTDENFLTTALP